MAEYPWVLANKEKYINGKSADIDKANELNKHFASIGSSINNQIHNNVSISDFLPDFHPPIFDIEEVLDKDIEAAIDRLSSSASCSFDVITAYIVVHIVISFMTVVTLAIKINYKSVRMPHFGR